MGTLPYSSRQLGETMKLRACFLRFGRISFVIKKERGVVMKKLFRSRSSVIFLVAFCVGAACFTHVSAQEKTGNLEKERLQLELERCRLEKERLELEIERLRLQKGFGAPVEAKEKSETKKSREKDERDLTVSVRAENISKEHEGDPAFVVFDTVNAELWVEGVRYSVYELDELFRYKGWPAVEKVVTRKPNGTPRTRVSFRNLSLEKYQDKKYGVFVFQKPEDLEDFRLQTVEGVSFETALTEVRNRFQNEYFRYDGMDRKKDRVELKYKHARKWKWDDRLIFIFDRRTETLSELRFGVLGEK